MNRRVIIILSAVAFLLLAIIGWRIWLANKVEAPLVIKFTIGKEPRTTGTPITFTDQTKGATEWLWNMDDGTTYDKQTFQHAWKVGANYRIRLTINGKFDTTYNLTITDALGRSEPAPKKEVFINGPVTAIVGQAVTFSDATPGADQWSWTIEGEVTNAKQVTHTFTDPGEYGIVLIVNGKDEGRKLIKVSQPALKPGSIVLTDPKILAIIKGTKSATEIEKTLGKLRNSLSLGGSTKVKFNGETKPLGDFLREMTITDGQGSLHTLISVPGGGQRANMLIIK